MAKYQMIVTMQAQKVEDDGSVTPLDQFSNAWPTLDYPAVVELQACFKEGMNTVFDGAIRLGRAKAQASATN